MSYSTKALALFGVLPLVLKQFAPGDVVLWYLFSTIISLQSIVDFGFRQTFLRVISYAFGGAKDIELFGSNQKEKTDEELEPNIALLTDIVSTMKYIYVRLTLVVYINEHIRNLGFYKTCERCSQSNSGLDLLDNCYFGLMY
ncbi:hypothetical protein ACFFJX_00845 [Pseudarcicella hirudinis]|uniref:hypothetical protein n=1 Tax=Pseudarcicella hirudinis TaxID=1079859 RepID=UPI0035E6C610